VRHSDKRVVDSSSRSSSCIEYNTRSLADRGANVNVCRRRAVRDPSNRVRAVEQTGEVGLVPGDLAHRAPIRIYARDPLARRGTLYDGERPVLAESVTR